VRLRRHLTAGLVVLAAILVAACTAAPPQPAPSQVRSSYERDTGNSVRRDCGYSSPLPGKPGWSIWLFCDTVITRAGGRKDVRVILGTGTAADGPYQAGRAPSSLTEVPTPPTPLTNAGAAAPEPFLPAPSGLQLPGSPLPCTGPGAYAAAWISGVTRVPSGTLLITYDDYCVTTAEDTPTAEGFGLATYDPASNQLGPVTPVFRSGFGLALPQQQVLGSPVAGADGYLYLFGFASGQVYVARTIAAPAYWDNPFTYQYWAGDRWSGQAPAAPLIPAGRALGISVGDYAADGHGLVMIAQTSLAGGFQAWQAASPAGPWRRLLAGRVPCTRGSETGTAGLCRALIGHPELSTRGRLLISYYDPGDSHVDVAAYPW
jgi:hypothetical protein